MLPKKNMLLDVKKPKVSRIARIENDAPDAFQQLLQDYWTWHYDDSLYDAVKLLLSTDLGWENGPQLITPPVGEVISPLGYALAHAEKEVRKAALQILDITVCVPAGTALIGEECTLLEIDEFEIGVYPVTNAQYYRFVEETGYTPPKEWQDKTELSYESYALKGDHPVVWVSCEDAEVYANYVGGRLPSFAEWQYAARGTDDRLFPWGYEIDTPRCNTTELGAEGTTPVGAFKNGITPFGCYDMIGNVWEWTNTPYDDKETFRVACGGAWYYSHDYSTCISFDFFSTNYAEFVIGFRIAR
ncbi:hypothetical protein C6501_18040 [Candidatus Poribacteria bacterium]|nr:MAG: hypothetical protein C6501_18040 [Candidatus Poribacteria bacterium]